MGKIYTLSIAGFDPCGGAGILADIKTFEQHNVFGFGVCTCISYQTENEFFGIEWFDINKIKKQLNPLLNKYKISFCKIGVIPSLIILEKLILYLKQYNKDIKIIWDPVLKATAGFDFFNSKFNKNILKNILKNIYLITPNLNEFDILNKYVNLKDFTILYLKGGHNKTNIGRDILYFNNIEIIFEPSLNKKYYSKHGSGCVLSAAINANLALNLNIKDACKNAKIYVEKFLISNTSLLGKHF